MRNPERTGTRRSFPNGRSGTTLGAGQVALLLLVALPSAASVVPSAARAAASAVAPVTASMATAAAVRPRPDPASVSTAEPPGRRVSYRTPPRTGDLVVAERHLVRCDSAAGARYTAESGFFAVDCTPAPSHGRWRVLSCRHVMLADGGLWLVEVVEIGAREAAVDEARRQWIPVPWHDWL